MTLGRVLAQAAVGTRGRMADRFRLAASAGDLLVRESPLLHRPLLPDRRIADSRRMSVSVHVRSLAVCSKKSTTLPIESITWLPG